MRGELQRSVAEGAALFAEWRGESTRRWFRAGAHPEVVAMVESSARRLAAHGGSVVERIAGEALGFGREPELAGSRLDGPDEASGESWHPALRHVVALARRTEVGALPKELAPLIEGDVWGMLTRLTRVVVARASRGEKWALRAIGRQAVWVSRSYGLGSRVAAGLAWVTRALTPDELRVVSHSWPLELGAAAWGLSRWLKRQGKPPGEGPFRVALMEALRDE